MPILASRMQRKYNIEFQIEKKYLPQFSPITALPTQFRLVVHLPFFQSQILIES